GRQFVRPARQRHALDRGASGRGRVPVARKFTTPPAKLPVHCGATSRLTLGALGAAKAAMYVSLFAKAGVAVALGPTTEPGVEGGIPAPAGVYMFWCPQPGVIVYQYRKGKLVPVPVGEPEPAKERRWKFELRPMTPQQQAAVATVTVGSM